MTAIAQPQVEIDVEGPGLEIDAAEMDDVDPGIHDALQPEEPVADVDDVPGAHFLREIDKIRVLHRDKLNRRADQPSAFVRAEAGRARHVAIGVEPKRTVETRHGVLRAVEAGQRITDLLAVLNLALRGVGGMGAAQRLDQQSRRVIALRPPPTRPLARRGGVTLGEFLAPGADRVEDHCGGGEKVVGEEAGRIALFRLGREVLQIVVCSGVEHDEDSANAATPDRFDQSATTTLRLMIWS